MSSALTKRSVTPSPPLPEPCCFCGSSNFGARDAGGAMLRCGARVAHELCAFFSSGIAVDLEQLPDDYEVGCLAGAGAVRAASLDAEAKRGAKLSCHLCGLKGATLGCYSCSRRSYHYPCAQRAAVWKPNLQPDFSVSVIEHFDAISSAVPRELEERNRFVQKSAESTSI